MRPRHCRYIPSVTGCRRNMDHIGIHIGGEVIIHCSVEVKTRKTSDKGWTHYAIPKGMEGEIPVVTRPTIRKGSVGPYVAECQEALLKRGYDLWKYGADGKFGDMTVKRINYIRSVDPMAYTYLVKALQLLQPQGYFNDSIL